MRKFFTIILFLMYFLVSVEAKQDIKNVILMIPDGTSHSAITLARWYKGTPLALDEIICGIVQTHSVEQKITDSAPAGTALACGEKTKTGFIGVDSALHNLVSVMELAKQSGLATGIVATCEFPHATPASFVAHVKKRSNYKEIIRQFIENSPDIVFAGGMKYVKEFNLIEQAKQSNIKIINDLEKFNSLREYDVNFSVWALFNDWRNGDEYMSYDCDRNTAGEPSLAEMTAKAIEILSASEKGFFLVIEGSQVDWAAHKNDPKALVTDMLAFDSAVSVALDFAKKINNTVVIACPDHGNGGLSIGNSLSNKGNNKYSSLIIPERIIKPLKDAKSSGRRLIVEMIDFADKKNAKPHGLSDLASDLYNIELSPDECTSMFEALQAAKNLTQSKRDSIYDALQIICNHKLSDKAFIGWTTTGHTAEDVFLAVYSPNDQRLTGAVDNTDIAKYIARLLNLGQLPKKVPETVK